jgi:hypothetical protein
MRIVKALYDFKPIQRGDLAFKKGDKLIILNERLVTRRLLVTSRFHIHIIAVKKLNLTNFVVCVCVCVRVCVCVCITIYTILVLLAYQPVWRLQAFLMRFLMAEFVRWRRFTSFP